MLKDLTRGGQVFLHQVRMIHQVGSKTCKYAFFFTLIIIGVHLYLHKAEYDYLATVSYGFAYLACSLSKILKMLSPKATDIKIFIVTKQGFNNSISCSLAKNLLHYKAYTCAGYLKNTAIFGIKIFIANLAMIFLFFSKMGNNKELKKGSKILDIVSANKLIGKDKGDLKLGKLHLIKNSEKRHLLISGATGSGKTNMLHNFLPQIRSEKALIVDQTGDMVQHYYREGDIIFNPFDTRSHKWDIYSELKDATIRDSFASCFYQPNKTSDDIWSLASSEIFTDTIEILLEKGETRPSEVFKFLTTAKKEDYKNRGSYKYFSGSDNATSVSMMMNVQAYSKSLKHLSDNGQPFTIKDWLNSENNNWLFLFAMPTQRSMMQPIISGLLDILILLLMNKDSDKKRTWIIIDELASLKKLKSLSTALSELRKYGGCIISAMQSISQLFSIYGSMEAKTMFSQFGTKAFFRMSEPNIDNIISSCFGRIEQKERNESISYGSHEMRDGVQISDQVRDKPLVTSSDIANLKDGQCYISTIDPKIKAIKMQLPLIKLKNKNDRFISREEVELPGPTKSDSSAIGSN